MKKILILTIISFLTVISFAQKPINPKIGKKELQTTAIGLIDDRLLVGGELVYRLPISKRLKIGAGALYGIDYDYDFFEEKRFGYGAIFGDAMLFAGQRQKWGLDAQIGHRIHSREIISKMTPGIYYSVSVNYRSIISKKILLDNAVLVGHRHFNGYLNSTFFLGLKTGIVF